MVVFTDEEKPETPSRAKLRENLRKRVEEKKNKEHIKRVERRKKALDKMKNLKKERASAIMEAACKCKQSVAIYYDFLIQEMPYFFMLSLNFSFCVEIFTYLDELP